MTKLSDLAGVTVFVPKGGRRASGERVVPLGTCHRGVFYPNGTRVAGFLVSRPDVAGMVRREDAFVALDSIKPCDGGLLVTRDDGMDGAAHARLGIAGEVWDACILWVGMDVVTQGGRDLGFVGDATFNLRTGLVESFLVGDGGIANKLVGSLEVPVAMLRGYREGRMVVDDAAATRELTGGIAAKAGVAAGRARHEGGKAAATVGKAADKAVSTGSRALGRQLGKTRGMFGAFMDEYRKASK